MQNFLVQPFNSPSQNQQKKKKKKTLPNSITFKDSATAVLSDTSPLTTENSTKE